MKAKQYQMFTKIISDLIDEQADIELKTNPLINHNLMVIKSYKGRLNDPNLGVSLRDKIEYKIKVCKEEWFRLKLREKEVDRRLLAVIDEALRLTDDIYERAQLIFT